MCNGVYYNIMLKPILTLFLLQFAPLHSQNVILFQPDEMRAESLGCYGHPLIKTPSFDAFAKQATRFDQAHVSYTVCSQSRVSFVTGWPTHVRGHRSLWALLHDDEPNLLKYFKNNSYNVFWRGKNDMLAHDSWENSVTTARQMGGTNHGPNTFSPEDPRYYSFLSDPTIGNANKTQDHHNVAEAIEFLAKQPKDEPFFIFLPLLLPHPPYSTVEPWYSMYDSSDIPDLRPAGLNGKPDYHALIRKYRNITSLDTHFWKKLHAVYLGSISFSDYLFGLLLAAVDEHGFRNSTTVAVFADHGDYAGDYGLVEKWPSGLEDVLTRVPLIIRTPGGIPGQVVKSPVQLFDIVPTLLDIANIPLRHVQFGVSQKAVLLHGSHLANTDRAVYAEGGYNEPRDLEGDASTGGLPSKDNIYYPKSKQQQEHPLSVCRAASVRTSTHKLIFRTHPLDLDHDSELYDLVDDPLELNNLYGNITYAAVQNELKQKLFLWYMQTSDVTPWLEDSRSGGYPWPPTQNNAVASDVGTDSKTFETGINYVVSGDYTVHV
jgi:arylsulfatase A-like enzyme